MKPLTNTELRQYPAICIRDTAVNFSHQQAWLLEGQKPLFVPDFTMAIALIQQNTGIGYIPHHLASPLLNEGTLVKKPMQEHKHATQLFMAVRSEGMGKVCKWCLDYLSESAIKNEICGK